MKISIANCPWCGQGHATTFEKYAGYQATKTWPFRGFCNAGGEQRPLKARVREIAQEDLDPIFIKGGVPTTAIYDVEKG